MVGKPSMPRCLLRVVYKLTVYRVSGCVVIRLSQHTVKSCRVLFSTMLILQCFKYAFDALMLFPNDCEDQRHKGARIPWRLARRTLVEAIFHSITGCFETLCELSHLHNFYFSCLRWETRCTRYLFVEPLNTSWPKRKRLLQVGNVYCSSVVHSWQVFMYRLDLWCSTKPLSANFYSKKQT